MSSGIKSIFKILIGFTFFVTVGMFLIEVYNLLIASELLKSTAHTTLERSCDYFAQESYKNGSGNAYQLKGYGGSSDTSLNGQFYYGSDSQVYDKLYTNSDEFKNYVNTFKDKYRKLKVLGKGLGLTHDILLLNNYEETRKQLSDAINVSVSPLSKDEWLSLFKEVNFSTVNLLHDRLTLMTVSGLIADEGVVNSLRITKNGLKKENRKQFFKMGLTFKKLEKDMNFICFVNKKVL